MEKDLCIKQMTTEDLDAVSSVEKAVFSMPWTKDGFAAALDMAGSNYLVAIDDENNLVGYCGYYSVLDEAEITNVAIAPPYRKKGYAKAMLLKLLEQAKQNGIKTVVLEVRFSNADAIGLYEKLGFCKLGIRKNFYELPKEDAIIMLQEI